MPRPAPRATLAALVSGLEAYGDRRAVGLRGVLGTRWWSYRELHQQTLHAARLLAAHGVGPGDHVLLRGDNAPEWVALFFGAVLRGAVVVPLDADSPAEHVAEIGRRVGARLLACDRPDAAEAALGVPRLALAAVARSAAAGGGTPVPDAADAAATVPPGVHPDDPALVYYTSGTTSHPRGVVLTHANLLAQVERFRRWRPLLRLVAFRMLVLAPLSHVQGMVLGVCVPLAVGAGVLYTRSAHPRHVVRAIRDDRITVLATVPRALQTLGEALLRRRYGRRGARTVEQRLATLRRRAWRRHHLFLATRAMFGWRFWVVFVGGAALPRRDEELWRDTGCIVVQGYGLTETAAVISVNRPLGGPLGSVGRPLSHQEVVLAPDGEILVRGPSVSPGYFRDPAATATAWAGGFLHTGDLGRLDRRRRLYVVGRKKDLVVTGEGFNVYPTEVEEAFAGLPGLLEVAVVGVDRRGHEEVHAALRLAPGARPELVVQAANSRLHPHQRVRSWTVWRDGDFPRTNLLKVRRGELARRIRERPGDAGVAAAPSTLEAVAAAGDRGERLALLLRYLAAAPPGDRAGEGARLVADLGLSSLDLVDLLSRLGGRTGDPLADVSLPGETTVGELRRLLADGQGPRADGARVLPARQPAWAAGPLGALARAVTRPVVLRAWAALTARVTARWDTAPRELPRRFLLAAAPHRHWLDGLVLGAALPGRWRRRLMLVTERDFHEHFDPASAAPWRERLQVAAFYHLFLPAMFPFAIVPSFGTTLTGLTETCRMLDRGCCPMTFPKGLFGPSSDRRRHDPGMAAVAIECQAPIVPVWLEGNSGLSFWPRRRPGRRPAVSVRFLAPIEPLPGEEPRQLAARVEEAFMQAAPAFFAEPGGD